MKFGRRTLFKRFQSSPLIAEGRNDRHCEQVANLIVSILAPHR